MRSAFGEILKEAVDATPGAIGGAFAAKDGESVDSWTHWQSDDWDILTAHFGIIMNHVRNAMHTFHFGDVETIYLDYQGLDLIIQHVAEQYFSILAVKPPIHWARASQNLTSATRKLRSEMF